MQVETFFFFDNVVEEVGPAGITIAPDRAKALAVGLVFCLFGITAFVFLPWPLSLLAGLPLLYGLAHAAILRRPRIVFDATSRTVALEWPSGLVDELPFSRIQQIRLERVMRAFFLDLRPVDGAPVLLAAFRSNKAEIQAYTLVRALERLELKVTDHSEPSAGTGRLRNKVRRVAPSMLEISGSFNEMPKDFLMFLGLLMVFALVILVILPPEAPLAVRVGFPAAALLLGLTGFLFMGGKDVCTSWRLCATKDGFVLEQWLLGRFRLRGREIRDRDILRVVARPYVYQRGERVHFSKGRTLHVVLQQQVVRIGALLSQEDISTLKRFFSRQAL